MTLDGPDRTEPAHHYEHTLRFREQVGILEVEERLLPLATNGVLALANSSILFDFSACNFLELDATLRLLPLLAHLKRQGNILRLELPGLPLGDSAATNSLWSYLLRWRFFEALRMHVDDPENLLSPLALDHLYDRSRYQQGRVLDPKGDWVLSFTHRLMAIHSLRLTGQVRPRDEVDAFLSEYRDWILFRALIQECGFDTDTAHQALAFIAEEGVLNAVAHAKGSFGVIGMQLLNRTTRRPDPVLVISVADDGVGIPEVMRSAQRAGRLRLPALPTQDDELLVLYTSFKVATDSLLVAASTREETSTDPDRAGMGLYFLKTEADKLGARLTIRSGHARVVFEGGDVVDSDDTLPYYPGTTIRVDVPIPQTD